MNIRESRRNWNLWGKQDPFFAILSYKEKRGGQWREADFFRTGEEEIKAVMEKMQSLHLNPPHGSALDFGCGVGRLTQALAAHFKVTRGFDIAPSMIELANHYNSERGNRCSFALNLSNKLPQIEDASVDFIYSNITLQHIEPDDTKEYLKEFMRILSSKGVLCFQLPTRQRPRMQEPQLSWRARIKNRLPGSLYRVYHRLKHIYRPTMEMYGIPQEEVTKLLESRNGTVVHTEPNQSAGQGWESLSYWVTKDRS